MVQEQHLGMNMIKWSLDSKVNPKTSRPDFASKLHTELATQLNSARMGNIALRDISILYRDGAVLITRNKLAPKVTQLRKVRPYESIKEAPINKDLLEQIKPLVKEAVRNTLSRLV